MLRAVNATMIRCGCSFCTDVANPTYPRTPWNVFVNPCASDKEVCQTSGSISVHDLADEAEAWLIKSEPLSRASGDHVRWGPYQHQNIKPPLAPGFANSTGGSSCGCLLIRWLTRMCKQYRLPLPGPGASPEFHPDSVDIESCLGEPCAFSEWCVGTLVRGFLDGGDDY
jgi:hypothetical protein